MKNIRVYVPQVPDIHEISFLVEIVSAGAILDRENVDASFVFSQHTMIIDCSNNLGLFAHIQQWELF